MSLVLTQVAEELRAGRLRVVDLTQPLSAQTPLLTLPSPWNNTPAFKIWELSRYDERGPAWYWNGFETGEHTGTHFDAPAHWISGKDLADNTVDRISPQKFVGPACVIDVSEEVARDPDYVITVKCSTFIPMDALTISTNRSSACATAMATTSHSPGWNGEKFTKSLCSL